MAPGVDQGPATRYLRLHLPTSIQRALDEGEQRVALEAEHVSELTLLETREHRRHVRDQRHEVPDLDLCPRKIPPETLEFRELLLAYRERLLDHDREALLEAVARELEVGDRRGGDHGCIGARRGDGTRYGRIAERPNTDPLQEDDRLPALIHQSGKDRSAHAREGHGMNQSNAPGAYQQDPRRLIGVG